ALGVGDPFISWLYQPGVRTLKARLYGDDLSFLQEGLPAVFMSDSSFSAYYPWYHQPTDTADRIDAASLARVGAAVLGIVQELQTVSRGPAVETTWLAAFGFVLAAPVLWVLAAASVAPGVVLGFARGGWTQTARLLQAALFGFVFWRHPVPALWVFLLPNLLSAIRSGRAA